MKRTPIAATRFSWKACALSGCTALALSTAAVGQANPPDRDRPLSDRPTSPSTTKSQDPQEHQTFEGEIKPLFTVLSEESADSGIQQPGSSRDAGRQPGTASQQPRSLNPTAGASQRAVNPQEQSAGSIMPSPLASATSQPLALVCNTASKSGGTRTRGSSPAEGPGATSPDRGSERTTNRSTGITPAAGMKEGEVYVLVFDPADPQSRSAYQMAQAIASSQHPVGVSHGSSTRTPPAASRPPGSGTEPTQRERDQQPGASDQPRTTDYAARGMDKSGTVKITGRVIEREGIQAIAVQQVDRQHDAARSTQPYQGGR